MKSGTVSKARMLLSCLCLAMLAGCTQAKDKNATSFLPGPIIGVQNPTNPPSGTNVGTSPVVIPQPPTVTPSPVATAQPPSGIPSPVSAPTIPPLVPTPNATPSIVPIPAVITPPTFVKSFSTNPVTINTPTTLTFTISNTAAVNLTGLTFTDTLPNALVIANPLISTNTCGGTLSAIAGGNTISLVNGTLAAGSTCSVTVTVVASAVGTYTNPVVTLFSNQAPPATSAPVPVSVTSVITPPTFVKSFSTSPVPPGTPTILTFTISNTAAGGVNLTGLIFTDVLPTGLVIANPLSPIPNTCGGTVSASAGGDTISLVNGTLPAGFTCSVIVTVVAFIPGTYTNPAVTLFSNQAPPATSAPVDVTFM